MVHTAHGCKRHASQLTGRLHAADQKSGQLGRMVLGSQTCLGDGTRRAMEPQLNVMPDIVREHRASLFWGCDPETTPWGFEGQMASRLCYWFTELGIKSIYICPDLNYGAAVHADKWIPIMPNTDAALQLAIAYVWITEGTYDKEYVATHTFGFDKFEEYVLGKEDGIAKTPEWAAEKCGVPVEDNQSAGQGVGHQEDVDSRTAMAGPASGGHTRPNLPGWRCCCWRCRDWENREFTRHRCEWVFWTWPKSAFYAHAHVCFHEDRQVPIRPWRSTGYRSTSSGIRPAGWSHSGGEADR